MKKYNIPIIWESIKVYEVEAENLQEAVEKSLKEFFQEPDDNYIENSFSIDNYVYDQYDEDYNIYQALKNT